MACGTPVVAAPEPAMKEVAGDAAIFTNDLAEGIRQALADRDRLSAAGIRRARAFTWRETALLTAGVYRKVLAG
jgi:glycosyltransferase involved in cell wall biosynthesis